MKERFYDAVMLRKLGIVGRDAIEEFRRKANSVSEIRGNTKQEPEANPYRRIYEQLTANRNPRNQREKNQIERYRRLMNERDAEILAEQEKQKEEMARDADTDFQRAKSHFVEVVNTMPVETAEDARDVAAATQALQDNNLSSYYMAVGAIADRRRAAIDKFLDDARKTETEAVLNRAQLEAKAARIEATSLIARIDAASLIPPLGSPAASSDPSA